jgi:MFS family permease
MLLAGLLYFTQISVGGSYAIDLLPGFLLVGVGLGFAFVPVSIAALAGVRPDQAGLASGLINTSQQIGGALGVAIMTTVATNKTGDMLAAGADRLHAFTEGYSRAFLAGGVFAAISLVATLVVIRQVELPDSEAAPSSAG